LIIDRTFTCIFFFEPKPPKKEKSPQYYRNPICLAKEYKRMIDTGEAKNQVALARKLGISRARVSQVLSILQLDKNLIETVEQLGDTMPAQIITERILRNYLLNPEMDKTKLFNKLFYDSRFIGND
jgi:biotin operon repressor